MVRLTSGFVVLVVFVSIIFGESQWKSATTFDTTSQANWGNGKYSRPDGDFPMFSKLLLHIYELSLFFIYRYIPSPESIP